MSGPGFDVVVVGAGPAGATAAFQLAGMGLSVVLLDRSVFPREKVCGESVSPGALDRLRTIGMWSPAEEGHGAMRIRGMRIRSPNGTVFRGRYRDGGPPGLVIRRTVLDAALVDAVRARGVRVMEGFEATGAEASGAGAVVIGRARETHGAPLRIAARRVVVADGRRSFLARQLGFLEPEHGGSGDSRFAVRAHCEGLADLSDFAEMQVTQGGYCGIAPLSPTSANVCYVLFRKRLDMAPHTLEADMARHLQTFPEVARRMEGARVSGAVRVIGPLRLRSRRQARGPFIACGDTTGFLDPFTGEGIAHAVASGVLAAVAVRASIEGRPGALREYETELRKGRRVKLGVALFLRGLVARRSLANGAASVFARMPRLGDLTVRLFGDQI